MHDGGRVAAHLVLLLAIAGCAHHGNAPTDAQTILLNDVPFFPQSRFQCGPAALATVLSYHGTEITPDALADQVYVPKRRGSFQVELKAAARRHGYLPHELEGKLAGLIRELEAGRPVLVLQNLLFDWLPRWHYAVVVGYDAQRNDVVLRSGRRRELRQSTRAFLRSWSLAGQWAVVALRPGELPADGTPGRYLQTLASSMEVFDTHAIQAALNAGLQRWDTDSDLLFAAGNLALERAELKDAAALYVRVLAQDSDHVGALNNYAETLKRSHCPQQALAAAERALAHAENTSLRSVVQDTVNEIKSLLHAPGNVAADCSGFTLD